MAISPLDADRVDGGLVPAMRLWARVISTPEPGLALLDAGKRDLPFDEGLPQVVGIPARVVATNDQHAFVRWEDGPGLRLGDGVLLDLSHPCTAFDKWRRIPLVAGWERQARLTGVLDTSF